MKILTTGGLGFIGSAFIRAAHAAGHLCASFDAGADGSHPANLDGLDGPRFSGDLNDSACLDGAFDAFDPDCVAHFAAESHVDRSITNPLAFVQANAMGSAVLLETSRRHHARLPPERQSRYRHLQVSTDEVFGALGQADAPFHEQSPLSPRSPYSASKAAGDLFAMAWWETFGLPTIVTRCSNNFGPRQFPEKLIPKTILAAADQTPIHVYGQGLQMRDWLHVDDHCRALLLALEGAAPGSSYAIGGGTELANIDLVGAICDIVDEELGRPKKSSRRLIRFVQDRAGHDFRYAIDSSKIGSELGWRPQEDFPAALRDCARWYLANPSWTLRAQELLDMRSKAAP